MDHKTVQESNISSSEKTNSTKILKDYQGAMKIKSVGDSKTLNTRMSLKNCALCRYKYKGKNKHQERAGHLYRKHFREMFIEEFGEKLIQSSPKCPHEYCEFPYKKYKKGKKDELFFHYFCKHGILKKYFDKEMIKIDEDERKSKTLPTYTKPRTMTEKSDTKSMIEVKIENIEPKSNSEPSPKILKTIDKIITDANIEDREDHQIDSTNYPKHSAIIKIDPKTCDKIYPNKTNPESLKEVIAKEEKEDGANDMDDQVQDQQIDDSKLSGKISKALFKPRKRNRSVEPANLKFKDDDFLDDEEIIFQTDISRSSMQLRKSKNLPKKDHSKNSNELHETNTNQSSEFEKSEYKDTSDEETDTPVIKSKPGPKSKQVISDESKALPRYKPGPKSKRMRFHEKTAELLPRNDQLTRENEEKKNYSTESKSKVSDIPLLKCELCEHNYKKESKNKSEDRSLHLFNKHFKEKFEEEFGNQFTKSLPNCPYENCPYQNPKQRFLLYHYYRKHGIQKKYFDEEITKISHNGQKLQVSKIHLTKPHSEENSSQKVSNTTQKTIEESNSSGTSNMVRDSISNQAHRSIFSNKQIQHMKASYLENR